MQMGCAGPTLGAVPRGTATIRGDIWTPFRPWRRSGALDAVEEAERPELEQLHRRHRGSRRGRAGARDGGGASSESVGANLGLPR